ncbi:Hypothetical_protein [Hexamita inflata]|uniref:Hypothetical_protein n=1 Tax=Hexamita inflata TaxID=28002 RepID=A0AA86QYW3_9EUKA|nr:Hypothetical protein HINF_LOCUS54815 [Hexamita inflata]
MQLIPQQVVTLEVEQDLNGRVAIDKSPFNLYQGAFVNFVKLKDEQPEIDYKQIEDNITFEELVATEFQFPTAMGCDGYLAIQGFKDDQSITEELIKECHKNVGELQLNDINQNTQCRFGQNMLIILVKQQNILKDIYDFEEIQFSELLAQKFMLTSLQLAINQLVQNIFTQYKDEIEKCRKNILSDRQNLNLKRLQIKNEYISFNDYIYPLNSFEEIFDNDQQYLRPKFNGDIKFKAICNLMNRVKDETDKYNFYVNIESEQYRIMSALPHSSYPVYKIITQNKVYAIMLLKKGIIFLKMQNVWRQCLEEAEVLLNMAAKLIEIQDVVLHQIIQLYLFFIQQLRLQRANQNTFMKLAKGSRILTCAGLGNIANDILKYIQNQIIENNNEINEIMDLNKANIPKQTGRQE